MNTNYEIKLDFEAIKLPPVTDILVLGKNYQHGKLGIFESLRFLAPDQYVAQDLTLDEFPNVGTIFVSKKVLRRMPFDKIIETLKKNVFDCVSETEAININFTVKTSISGIEI